MKPSFDKDRRSTSSRVADLPSVCLISMPFASLSYPNIGLSLLKGALEREGGSCDIRYFSLDYADFVGVEAYEFLTDERYFTAFLGEMVFSHAVFDRPIEDMFAYIQAILSRDHAEYFSVQSYLRILDLVAGVPDFLDKILRSVPWQDYRVVGFTSSFQQTMASLALAKRVKEAYPHLQIVMGGANCEGEMGLALHRNFPFLDAVCSGEGDLAFPAYLRALAAGDETAIPGMIQRRKGTTAAPGPMAWPVEDLNALPIPDYSDFFAQHRTFPTLGERHSPLALFESARGCWWGAKNHCTFCGLNGGTMNYRSKAPERALAELSRIVERHGREVLVVDNILDMKYFKGFLPELARSGLDATLHYEVKTNLTPEQLTILHQAGIRTIQPGIETLETGILKLMNKGCTALQNVQILKLSLEVGLYVVWNFLYGFPGESPDQYDAIARILPQLSHLQPPAGAGRVRADRFSPYFKEPERFGASLTPAAAYSHIYRVDAAELPELAYHFDMHAERSAELEESCERVILLVKAWQRDAGGSSLTARDLGEVLLIEDRRGSLPKADHRLDGAAADLLRYCWKIRSRREIRDHLSSRYPPEAIDAAFAQLREAMLIAEETNNCLSLPLRQPGHGGALQFDKFKARERNSLFEQGLFPSA
jgi:ribosomal peptide maturation radical SAM protein 1